VTMGEGAVLAADSFLMKGEEVLAHEQWGGNPARALTNNRINSTAQPVLAQPAAHPALVAAREEQRNQRKEQAKTVSAALAAAQTPSQKWEEQRHYLAEDIAQLEDPTEKRSAVKLEELEELEELTDKIPVAPGLRQAAPRRALSGGKTR
jgi:septal ring factor EnvC (AmiA/AmiB activator)